MTLVKGNDAVPPARKVLTDPLGRTLRPRHRREVLRKRTRLGL